MNDTKNYNRDFIYSIPESVLHHQTLTYLDKHIYMLIRSFMDTTGNAYPSNGWIAKRCGVERRSVITSLNRLIKEGFVIKKEINNRRYLFIKQSGCPVDLVISGSPPHDPEITPPSDPTITQLDQNNIRSKSINNNITRAREPEQELTTQEPSQDDYQETYYMQPASQPPATTSQDYGGYELNPKQQSDFERFWLLYPRKTSRARTAAQWFHDGCHLIADKIIEKLKEQIAKDASFLDGCVPNPHRYIVEKRYNDEVFQGKQQKGFYNYDDTSWANKKDIFDEIE